METKDRDTKGRFAKGNTGRPKGAKNKSTKAMKEKLAQIVRQEVDTLESHIGTLEPADRIRVLQGLINYVIPKQGNVSPESPEIAFAVMEGFSDYLEVHAPKLKGQYEAHIFAFLKDLYNG